MKKNMLLAMALALGVGVHQLSAQFGPGGMGDFTMRGLPKFDGKFNRVFGENTAFSGELEVQLPSSSGETKSIPAKVCSLDGRMRLELDMASLGGANLPPDAAAQMKAMGMDRMVLLNDPAKKTAYMIYPGLESYVEFEQKDAEDAKAAEKHKLETTELGKETITGHPCVKNKVVITDDKGATHEFTTWNATDLKKFPLKIVTSQGGKEVTMLFKNPKLAKPDAALFELPKNHQRYGNFMEMMQEAMMKKFGGAPGTAPPPNR